MGCTVSHVDDDHDDEVVENTRWNQSAMSPRDFLEKSKGETRLASDAEEGPTPPPRSPRSPRETKARELQAVWEDRLESTDGRLRSSSGRTNNIKRVFAQRKISASGGSDSTGNQRSSGRLFGNAADKRDKKKRAVFASKDYVVEFDPDSKDKVVKSAVVEKPNEIGIQKRKQELKKSEVGSGELV